MAGSEGNLELTMLAGGNFLSLIGPFLDGAVLGAVLNDAPIFLRCFDQFSSFEDVVTERFLDVNVFACLTSPDRHQAVPMVGGGDGNDVDLLVVQHLSHVLDAIGGILELTRDELLAAIVKAGVGIDQVGDRNVLLASVPTDMRSSPSLDSANRYVDSVIGSDDFAG